MRRTQSAERHRAVFLSCAGSDQWRLRPVVQQISNCGAVVFTDETWNIEPDAEERVLTALSFADELLVYLSCTPALVLRQDAVPAFLERRFIWMALAAAKTRGLPIQGLVNSSITRDDVEKDKAIPGIFKSGGVALFEEDTLQDYLDLLRGRIEGSVRAKPGHAAHCRVCLTHDAEAIQFLSPIESKLKHLGFITSLDPWKKGPGGVWGSTIHHFKHDYDAVVVFFGPHGFEAWNTGTLSDFLRGFVYRKRPVILVNLSSAKGIPNLPAWLSDPTCIDYRRSNRHSLLEIVWGIVGYRDFASGPVSGYSISNTQPKRSEDTKTMSADATATRRNNLTLLHLSDLHFNGQVTAATKVQWLVDDIMKDPALQIKQLDFVVISGDFTDKGQEAGFPIAREFIEELCQRFNVPKHRCLVVPGNHDLQELENAYQYKSKLPPGIPEEHWVAQGDIYLVRSAEHYQRRFEAFSRQFYEPLFAEEYPLDYVAQGVSRLFVEERLQFVLLNSAWQIDQHFRRRAGIHQDSLARAMREADNQCEAAKLKRNDVLRIAVWHHAVRGSYQMENTNFLTHLQKNFVKLCLHGDVHEFRREWIGYWHETSSLQIVGAGSFASPKEGRGESTPCLYNLLQIDRDFRNVRVHTRAQDHPDGSWEGWSRWPAKSDPVARMPYFDIELITQPR